MLMKAVRGSFCLAAAALLVTSPAAAQVPDASGICALINFRFCDQPTAPVSTPTVVPPPPVEHVTDHRKHRRKQTTTPSG